MKYDKLVEGWHERFATVPGINALVHGEPVRFEPPTLYTLLDRFERSQQGQITVMQYRTLHRLVFRWQDNEAAEVEMTPFVNAIPHAVDQDPQLGERLKSGLARIVECQATFVTIGGTLYRCLDFYGETVAKAAYRSGL